MSFPKKIPLFSLLSLLLCSILLCSCGKESLEITPDDKQSANAFPEFNFNIESVSPTDTIGRGDTIYYNLYLRQQLSYVKGRNYFVCFTLPDNYEGEGYIYQAPWRSKDLILINYDQVVKDNFRVQFAYRPLHRTKGNYQITFSCKDEAGKVMTFSKSLSVQ